MYIQTMCNIAWMISYEGKRYLSIKERTLSNHDAPCTGLPSLKTTLSDIWVVLYDLKETQRSCGICQHVYAVKPEHRGWTESAFWSHSLLNRKKTSTEFKSYQSLA